MCSTPVAVPPSVASPRWVYQLRLHLIYFLSSHFVHWITSMRMNIPVNTEDNRSETNPVETVIQYHVQTKHHFHRYARAAGYLDWANQPDPFRRYEGTILTPLPLLGPDEM